jgi:predicted  nucleic acid-binding Zn-ribbon protein
MFAQFENLLKSELNKINTNINSLKSNVESEFTLINQKVSDLDSNVKWLKQNLKQPAVVSRETE